MMKGSFIYTFIGCIGLVLSSLGQPFDFKLDSDNYNGLPSLDLVEAQSGTVKIADLNGDGLPDVVNLGNLIRSTNSTLSVLFQTADGKGWNKKIILYEYRGSFDNSFELGDIDQDGDLDIFTAYRFRGSSNPVHVFLLNDGQGNFTMDTNQIMPQFLRSRLVDIDGDGDIDILGTQLLPYLWPQQRLDIFENDGSGNFTADTTQDFLLLSSSHFEVADLDQNGVPEILQCGRYYDSINANYIDTIVIHYKQLSGAYFQIGLQHKGLNLRVHITTVLFEDFDLNGTLDLVIYQMQGSGTGGTTNTRGICVYNNDGSGILNRVVFNDQYFSSFYTNTGRIEAAVGDFTGDSLKDILVGTTYPQSRTSFAYGEIMILENKGGNVFELDTNPRQRFYTNNQTNLLFSTGDVNMDNLDDLIIVDWTAWGEADLRLFTRDSMGILNEGKYVFEDHFSRELQLVDLDNDSDLDILQSDPTESSISEVTMRVYWNDGLGNYTAESDTFLVKKHIEYAEATDFDADGDMDILRVTDDDEVQCLENDGFGNFQRVIRIYPQTFTSIQAPDLNNDGQSEMVCYHRGGGGVRIYMNTGNFLFVLDSAYSSLKSIPLFSDVDLDGDLDMLAESSISGTEFYCVYKNDGNGKFSLYSVTTLETVCSQFKTNPCNVKLGDLNHDGYVDLIGTYAFIPGGTGFDILENDGTGNFTSVANSLNSSTGGGDVHVFDANSDGKNELLLFQPGSQDYRDTVRTLSLTQWVVFDSNFVATTFTDSVIGNIASYNNSSDYICINTGDMDGDGDQDLLLSGTTTRGKGVYFYRNNTFGGLSNQEIGLSVSLSAIPVYPNPFSDKFSIELSDDYYSRCVVYNVSGQVIDEFNAKGKVSRYYPLPKGIYILKIYGQKGEVSTMKLVKN
jgi:hypothetical protein